MKPTRPIQPALFAIVTGISLLLGCATDEFELDRLSSRIKATPGVSIPLARANVEMRDILTEGEDLVKYYTDEDGNERLRLWHPEDSVVELSLKDFFNISAGALPLSIPQNVFNLSGFSGTTHFPVNLSSGTVSSFEASIEITVEYSNFAYPVDIEITFPSVNNAEYLSMVLNNTGVKTIEIDPAVIEVTNGHIPVTYSIAAQNSNDVFPSTIADALFSFKIVELRKVRGVLGQKSFTVDTTIYDTNFEPLDDIDHDIRIKDPALHLTFSNGSPYTIQSISYIWSTTRTGHQLNFEPNPVTIETDPAPNSNTALKDTITFNQETSPNVQSFFEQLPSQVFYKGEVTINPGGTVSDEIELTQDNSLVMGFIMDVPLTIAFSSTIQPDTVDLDLGDITDNLEKGELLLQGSNGFPFTTRGRVLFWDEQTREVIDSVMTQPIEAAETTSIQGDDSELIVARDNNGQFLSTPFSQTIELTNTNIDNLRKSEKLIIFFTIESSDYSENKMVTLLTGYQFLMRVDLRTQLDLDL